MKRSRLYRIILSIFVGCLLLSVPFALSAAAQSTNISATAIAANAPNYEMTIPATIRTQDLHRTTGSDVYSESFEITVSDLTLLNGRRICVRLYSEDDCFALYHAESGVALPFEVYGPLQTDVPMKNGDVFAYFTTPGAQTGYIRIDQKDITTAGTYSGAIHFAVSVASGE